MPVTSLNNVFRKRTAAVTVFFFLCFCVIVARLVYLQIIQGQQTRALADDQHSFFAALQATRGEIKISDRYSPEGYVVATNIKKPLVYAVPPAVSDPQGESKQLAAILNMDQSDLLNKLTEKDKKYVVLKHQLTDDEVAKLKDSNLGGIGFDEEIFRFYPENNLLSQTLGFVGYNKDSQKVGLYGLEKYFEKDLAGKDGFMAEEKDTAGAWIFGGKRQITEPINGETLILTIDKTLQFKAESVLQDTVTKHGADGGSVIIMNPKTGAILAMADYPNFDPNNYNKVTDPQIYNNLSTTGIYEPGSTFKAITMSAALDEGKITPDTTYVDTGKVKVSGKTINNAEPGARGVQSMTQALDFSLNTGAIFAENLLGNNDFLKYLNIFGFGKKTGIELPEAAGSFDNLKDNVQVNFDTASFGQGISVTPLQMVQAYGALANSGVMTKPYIVQAKIFTDGSSISTQPVVLGQVISPKTANTISAMLVDVVENGFGAKAKVPGYYIAGKTGTAQVPRGDGKPGYDPDNNIGSFIGYGPVENPEFVMLVRIDHPRDVKFAESTAGPAFGQLSQFILNYYNIPPTRK